MEMGLTATSSRDSKACALFNYSRRCKQKILNHGYRQHTGTPLAACDCLLKMNAAEPGSWVELLEQPLREGRQRELPWTGAPSIWGFGAALQSEATSSMKVRPQFV